ncbi:L-2-hydroxyglutarate dehydrogenase, mitochondrial [Seminavis robusta]|uniref:L-2-hydroxyglutarate dehydrogenase, mitochondrial n=1 Tax=Seminavis robusta TaxID=568900 RepID=A0A9N8HH22_9STRA|nr:L-2-hydroxyglutarate dehydrogenase, mitochondrial [Seminavis robusta]|eukprot:Sro514_g158090.1 L-2-hydroxyglutarate dehydrogenase, mitochondrial (748) ;mRNA; f:33431-35981
MTTEDRIDSDSYWYVPPAVNKAPPGARHGRSGVYYGGSWLDIEDCDGAFNITDDKCSGCPSNTPPKPCPRSRSRPKEETSAIENDDTYDVLIIGAGCIGAAIAREISKYSLKTLWLEAADDVSQGATKGNSGIVHAGYDDTPGGNHAKYCWPGNQMFAQLDRELRFGYQINGSLVVAFNDDDMAHLKELKKRGETNGVQNLRIVDQTELRKMEPHINEEAIAALYSPDAGNVIPYEFAIALAENAVDNGVELRIRREVQSIVHGTPEDANGSEDGTVFTITVRHWEPQDFVNSLAPAFTIPPLRWPVVGAFALIGISLLVWLTTVSDHEPGSSLSLMIAGASAVCGIIAAVGSYQLSGEETQSTANKINLPNNSARKNVPFVQMVEEAGAPLGTGKDGKVETADMLVGGSGSSRIQQGVTVDMETVRAKYIVNCAGGASDQIAGMIGDNSFKIKPRLGDYLLLHRNQGRLAKHTLFPCPDPILGKGVLVQTTLWGNLILGPTARDIYKPEALNMTDREVQEYILSKCKRLVPGFDPKETIHAFCGARAKSDRGDWIIETSAKNPNMVHVAGIDSPGLAGSPAIALEVIRLLKEQAASTGKEFKPNLTFNPHRAPIIKPKEGMKGLKMGPVGKNDSGNGTDEEKMAANVVCKCERVTELEVVRAMRRSLPIDSSQAIRKRTRAGMGHCQGDKDNYNCEGRVRAIIARELGNVPLVQVGGRPWPATSTLTQRWIDDTEKRELEARKQAA